MAYKPTFGESDYKHEPEGHGLSSSSKKASAKHQALKQKTSSFEQGKCKHGTSNSQYCESCSHPNRAKANESRIPFKDKMSQRKD